MTKNVCFVLERVKNVKEVPVTATDTTKSKITITS